MILILIAVSFHSTWTGPAWSPAQSISSVLISIQSLMTENPYHNEPGFEQVLPLPQCILKVIAHWVRNVCTLKDKYDLTLCQSRLHTASKMFIRHKKFGSGSFFFFLHCSHPWQAFWEVFWQFRATVQAIAKIQLGDCQIHPLHLTVYRSLHTEFTEIDGLPFNMWL